LERIRSIIAYKHYFEEFLAAQPKKIQDKIYKILELIEFQQRIPSKYLKHMESGLYETRVSLGSNIWRVFCFFDKGKLVVLLNGFQKKTQKTPRKEIDKALKLMKEYYATKNQ
jgi:phage-related protein